MTNTYSWPKEISNTSFSRSLPLHTSEDDAMWYDTVHLMFFQRVSEKWISELNTVYYCANDVVDRVRHLYIIIACISINIAFANLNKYCNVAYAGQVGLHEQRINSYMYSFLFFLPFYCYMRPAFCALSAFSHCHRLLVIFAVWVQSCSQLNITTEQNLLQ